MQAIIIGTETGISDALSAAGYDVTIITGLGTKEALDDADVTDAALLVVTDVGEATAISIAKDANPDIRVVVYAAETMPEFVRGQVDFAVAPDVLAPDVLAEELVGAEAGR